MPTSPPRAAALQRSAQHFQQFKQEFQRLEYFCKGTVLRRMVRCGRPQCACRRDPAQRHGPYFEWTYKAKGTTVNVKLTAHSARIYQAATQQYKKLKALLKRLERLSRTALAHLAKQSDSHTKKPGYSP
jgi:hypothetical protein